MQRSVSSAKGLLQEFLRTARVRSLEQLYPHPTSFCATARDGFDEYCVALVQERPSAPLDGAMMAKAEAFLKEMDDKSHVRSRQALDPCTYAPIATSAMDMPVAN